MPKIHRVPASARNNAQQVLDWREEHGRDAVKGMTATGWRRARQLATEELVDDATVKAMSQFNRHRENYENARRRQREEGGDPWTYPAIVAWLGWGGTTGINWAREVSQSLDKAMEHFAEMFKPDPNDQYSGLLVSVWLDEQTSQAVSSAYGQPLSDLHITLHYCPNARQYGDSQMALALGQISDFARGAESLQGKIGGIGRFNASESSEGRDVIYGGVDVPGLAELREEIRLCLAMADIQPSNSHGYTPHVTLEYIESGAPFPVQGLPDIPLTIDDITVSIGDNQAAFPLGQEMTYKAEFYTTCSVNGTTRLFNALSFATPPTWINYLPIPNVYQHPIYGDVEITRERNERFADQFNSGIYQTRIPIDAEHETKLSGAVGWITTMRTNDDGSVDAQVEWTPRGQALIENDSFHYFSPEWYDQWQDPATGQTYQDIAVGGAITTRPFFKDKALRPLITTERRIKHMPQQFGELADFLNMRIDEMVSDDMTRADIVAELADAAGIEAGTVNQILRGDIERPPDERIRAMARVLDVPLETLMDLLPAEEEMTVADTMNEELQDQLEQRTASERRLAADNRRMAGELVQLQERVALMEKTERARRFSDVIANSGSPFLGDRSTHLSLMETLGEGSREYQLYVQQQQHIAEQAGMARLFTQYGSDNPQGRTAIEGENPFMTAVKRAMNEHGISEIEAIDLVNQENPQLYKESYG